MVTLEFVCDAQRFAHEVLSVATLFALTEVLLVHAARSWPVNMSDGQLVLCAGAYAGAVLALALLQGARVLDVVTLLAMQQVFVLTTLLVAGQLRSSAHC